MTDLEYLHSFGIVMLSNGDVNVSSYGGVNRVTLNTKATKFQCIQDDHDYKEYDMGTFWMEVYKEEPDIISINTRDKSHNQVQYLEIECDTGRINQ